MAVRGLRNRHLWSAALLLTALAAPPGVAAGREEEEARLRLESVRREIQTLRERIARDEGEAGRLQGALRTAETEVAEAAARLARTDAAMMPTRKRLGELEARRSREIAAAESEKANLAKTLRTAWRIGRQDRLRLLLNQQDPAAIDRVLAWHGHLNRTRIERIAAVRQSLDQLAATEHALGVELRALNETRAKQKQAAADLEQERRARGEVLAALRLEMKGRQGTLEALVQDGKQLEALLRALERALADIPVEAPTDTPFQTRRGRMGWPAAGEIRARFGDARAPGGALIWRGLFIAGPTNRPVRAVHHGRVVFSDWMRGFGHLVILDHGGEYMSLYGHLQQSARSTGEWVQTGDELGRTGDSGGQDEPGLYFEIRHKGKPQDPVAWCSGTAPPRG